MKRIVLCLILACCYAVAVPQSIFNPNDSVVTYNPNAPAGSQSNPNQAFGYNIIKWVRTVRMSWNTSRYKCYMIGNIPFRLRFPDSYNPTANDGKKYPIMLFFHGGGEATPNTRDNEFHLLNGGSTFAEKIQYGTQDAFILFPQSRNVGWDNSYFVPMNIVIDSLIKNCKGDEDRVISMGLSIGGAAAMDYAIAYPKRASTIIPNSPVFISTFNTAFGPAVHIPLWMGSGGADTNPDPTSVENFTIAYKNTGGDLYWSYYPRQGHVMWDYQWADEPNYSDRMATSHKANPLVFFNNRFFCPGSPVNARMGITPGFYAYQWDKNGTIIPSATSNEYIATDFGTYRARFKRTATAEWSAWSLLPAVISPVCPPTTGTGTGLNANYYNNLTLTAPSSLTRVDPALNFVFDNGSSPGTGVATFNYSTRWTGKIQPQFSETYTLYTKSDDGIRLWINGTLLIDNFTDHGATENTASFSCIAGVKYDIKIEYYNKGGQGVMSLKWSSPSTVKQMVPTRQLYPEGNGDPGATTCTTNLLPANNAALATTSSTNLTWNPVSTAGSYDVYLWSGATAPASPTANVTTSSYTAVGLIPGNTYKWFIAPRNGNGAASGCAVANTSTFTINPNLPACVANLTPGPGTTIATATTANLTWQSAPNATAYDLYLFTGATPPLTPTATLTTLQYNASNLLPATTYSWYIIPKNISGSAADCNLYNKTTFTTAAASGTVPACVVNTAPVNGSVLATQTSAALSWPAAATATSYDLYVWTGATPPASPTANTSSTSYNATGLLPGTMYNWYVSARNASGAATGCDLSNTTSFTTAAAVVLVPGCATNIAPASGTTLATQTTASLSWSTVANASSYDLYLWTGATPPATATTNVTGTTYNASALLPATLYNWYIVPKNASGAATGCDLTNKTSFTTASVALPVPGCATNTAPVNGTTLATQTTASLSWSTVANANSYDVYLWNGIAIPTTPVANVTGTTYNATGLTADSLYNWYIVPKNVSGAATGCDISNRTNFFTAAPLPVPACVANTAPINGAVLATQNTAALSWASTPTATSYDVYLWSGVNAPATPTGNIAGTSYNASNLQAGTLYNWYVSPRNASGAATGCSTSNKSSFTTATATVTPGFGIGLQGVYYNGTAFAGTALLTRVDPTINFELTYSTVLSPAPGVVPPDNYSVRWTGQVKPLYSETYTFYTVSDDGIRLWVNGVQLGNNFVNQGATEKSGSITLVAGQKYDIVIEYYEATGEAVTKLYWSSPSTPKAIVPQSQLFPPGFVDPTVPGCASNSAPANGSSIASASAATLSWNLVPDASSYDVYVFTGATAPATPTATVSTNTYAATGLSAATLYNWFVVPRNIAGAAIGCGSSNTTIFTTGAPPPACSSNLLPANNTVLPTANTATLSWAAAATATSYDVFIWTGSTAPLTPIANTSSTSYNATGLLAASVYNWYIVPRNAGGAAIGCNGNLSVFTTALAPAPGCTSNASPANNSTIVTPNTAALSWNAAINAISYDIYIWTGATPPASPVANVGITSYTATGLTPSTLYKWYVVPKNAAGAASSCSISNTSSFTTGAPSAGIGLQGVYYNGIAFAGTPLLTRIDPTINFELTYSTVLSPAPGVVPPDNYSVRWSGQVKALYSETYTFYTVSDDGIRLWVNGVQLVNNFVNQGATEKSGSITLVAGQKYDVLIEYYENVGEAVTKLYWSSPSTPKAIVPQSQLYPPGFTDPVIPGCVSNTSPVNAGNVVTAASAPLSWSNSPDASSYDVYLWTGATPASTPIANVSTNNYTATGLTAATTYNWYVVPKNNLGAATGCSSNATSFTTGAPAPACTSNLLPANNAVLATPNSANLSWTASATATSYDVYIWTGAIVPTTPVANVPGTSYGASGLTAGVTYNWYVSPRNASGPAVGCVSNKTVFVTAAAPVPACAVNLLPANGSTLTTASTATLTWNPVLNASSYDVFIWTGATPPATPVANVSGTSYAAAGLTLGSLYNWYVVPKNAAGSASGCNSSASFSFTTASEADGTGLQGVYYNGTAFAGTPLLTRVDPTINFELTYSTVLSPAPGVVPPDNYSVRWTGQVKPLYSETYTFYTVSDDGIRLWVNGVQLVNNFVNQGATEKSGSITLVAGQKYDIVIEYYEATGEAVTKLYWSSPSTPKAIVPQSQLYPPAAASAARIAAASSTDSATSSPLASVVAQPTISSTVSPNPVNPGQQARLQINSDKPGNAYISIVNSMGFVVNTRQVSLATGSNTVTINTSSLSLGLYIISISGGTTPVNLKLLVE